MAVAELITIPSSQKAPVSLRAIHAEWRAAKDAYNALPDDCDAATDAAAFRRITAASDSAMQWKPLSVQDMALKIIIADDGGDMKANVDQEALAETAYELAGIDRATGAERAGMTVDQGPLTMSSREIADLCSKRHDNVMRDAKAMFNGLQINALKFEGVYRDTKNEQRPCYNLPKDLTLTLVAGYNVVLRKRIIDRWLELEGQQVQQFGYQAVDLSGVMASLAELRDLVMTLTKQPDPVAPAKPALPTRTDMVFRSRRVAAPKVRRDIPRPLRGGGAPMPDFAAAKEGQSFHVKTAEEYNRIASNFKYWKKKNDAQLKISRRAVGADDPDGPGFRIWYVNDDPWL